MAEPMDLVRLRSLIEGVLVTLYQLYGHRDLPELCERLGLPKPPAADAATKHERLATSLRACPDSALPQVAEAILDSEPLAAEQRNALQDVLWRGRHYVEIPGRTRRELAQELDLSDHLRYPDRFLSLLSRLWVLDDDPLSGWLTSATSLRTQIERHVIRFPDDWSAEELFEQLGAFEAPHPRFGYFLEGLASSAVLPDEEAQCRFVALANSHLRSLGALLRQEGEEDGYPLFRLVQPGRGPGRRPRNLIFATMGKPDIRFSSALDNDIEVAERAD